MPDSNVQQDPRWAQVLARDVAADGQFVYAVRSTGVYCRPSCGARNPKPQNVEFHADAAAAEAAGFRACRRCHPQQASPHQQQAARVAAWCAALQTSDPPPSLSQLAQQAGLSPYHLQRVFKQVTGLTPKQYALAWRAQQMRQTLGQAASVTDAMYDVGYSGAGRFYAESNQVLGMTPSRFRAGGAAQNLRFAVGQCSLGAVLVAASAIGVCAILLGDDAEALLVDLHKRFPKADLLGGDADFEQTVATVIGLIEAPHGGIQLPLDIRGTVFQQKVWRALQGIPPGETLSYRQLAERIGAPQAVRAVAGACAANPLAVAIPCHRVVRLDGGLAGYRWGIDRKQRLLAREASERTKT